MSDAYTKVVLTVIAAALVALVFQRSTPPVVAQGASCGSNAMDPCYVASGLRPLKVVAQ